MIFGFLLVGRIVLADSWQEKDDMPNARQELNAGVLNGKIYVVGGWNGVTDLDVNEEYDPASDSWSTRLSMPTSRSGLTVSVVEDSLYAIGGLQGFSYLSTNEMFNLEPTSIKISSFSVNVNGQDVNLTWSVNMENSNTFYRIVRKSLEEDFEYREIAKIPGSGSSPAPVKYSYKDKGVRIGKRYNYKLGVVENNGHTTWYGPESIVIPKIELTLSIYPNPFTGNVKIKLGMYDVGCRMYGTSIKIYDTSGRLVKSFPLSTDHSIQNTAVFWDGKGDNGKLLPSGLYYLRYSDGASAMTKKVLFLR